MDEGRSFTTAAHYAKDGVWIIGVDYIDPPARNKYMNTPTGPMGWNPTGTGLIDVGAPRMFIHGDGDMVDKIFDKPISLFFIDGDHSYEGVKLNTLNWVPKVRQGGTILFHDYDHPDTKRWLDEYYGDNKEVLHNKIVRVRV